MSRQVDAPGERAIARRQRANRSPRAVHEQLEGSRAFECRVGAPYREHEAMFSIRDPFQRERKVGAMPACPNPLAMTEGPTVAKPAEVSQLGELCGLARADREAPVERQRVQMETETAWIGTHTQIDRPCGFIEVEVEDGATSARLEPTEADVGRADLRGRHGERRDARAACRAPRHRPSAPHAQA